MVFQVEEQDPNEIEFFEFTLPGVYEQAVVKGGVDKGKLVTNDDGSPVYTKTLEIHRLPKMQYLGVAAVEQIDEGGLAGIMRVFGGNADAIRGLNGKQLGSLMSAWRAASAVSLGESEG